LAAGDLPPGEYRLEAVVAYLKGPGDFGAYQFILPDEPWTRITVRAGTFVFGGRLVVNPEQSYSLEKVRMLLETTPAAEQAARQTLARRLRHSPWGKVLAHPPPAPPADPHFSPQPTPQPSAGEIRGEICNMTPYFGG
ncbi:MAG: hypothetical protein OEW12_08530, partial [Deltaproteobacteria bacterium]|nr:hypothetical protein [Deltaproteobacteria bacterium]